MRDTQAALPFGHCLFVALALSSCTPRGGAADAGNVLVLDTGVDAMEANAPDTGAPQDNALPPPVSEEFTSRARHLLEAIAKDDPSLATDIVFPRDAYLLAKDSDEPGKQWDTKVMGAFRKQVHLLHKRTSSVGRAQFTSFEIGQPIGQIVPKRHDMRLALWRVRHSRLGFSVDGKAAHFDVGELLSWQGAWYVVELR